MKNNTKSYPRGDKIAMTVRQLVAEIIRDIFPDLGVTIVDAKSGDGLQFVRVFYQGQKQDFEKIKGRIRYELAHRMNQKHVPELEFAYDDTLEVADRIETLLKNI
ncbi:MAG: ribosome-binding factor A [Rickettsiales bacterium]|jgi:ribosome-binding factor A|nr:ribosome-binding factor A [Rickettsiales bacterium]